MSARDWLRPPDPRKAKGRVAAAFGESNDGSAGKRSIAQQRQSRQARRYCEPHARFVIVAAREGYLPTATAARSLAREADLLAGGAR